MAIQILSPHVVHHIAAGEVVDRPVSILKELIENSLDAGATQIEVAIEHSGVEKIQVIDNGHGISETDFEHVFTRYATSKLHAIDDLLKLHSFGFRGEALFSIMTAGDVQIISKTATENFGTEAITHNGRVEHVQPIGARNGTQITVTDVFKKFPVRREAVNNKNEWFAIKKLVESYALLQPNISFRLTHNNQLILATLQSETVQQRMEHFWNLTPTHTLLINENFRFGKIHGYISLPEFSLTQRKHQILSINQRWISDPTLQHVIEDAMRPLLMKGKYPQYVLQLEINPHLVDVNIHPQKKAVKFLNETEILESIKTSIQHTLFSATAKDVRYTSAKSVPSNSVKEFQPSFKIFGEILQMDNTYLIAHTSQGILLVDQHAADEKLWYNNLMSDKKLLQKVKKKIDAETQQELDDDIYQHSFPENVHATIATIACHQAIRAGQSLSQTEMSVLIEKIIYGGTSTLTCPHGRPTHMFISVNQLEKMFRRK